MVKYFVSTLQLCIHCTDTSADCLGTSEHQDGTSPGIHFIAEQSVRSVACHTVHVRQRSPDIAEGPQHTFAAASRYDVAKFTRSGPLVLRAHPFANFGAEGSWGFVQLVRRSAEGSTDFETMSQLLYILYA